MDELLIATGRHQDCTEQDTDVCHLLKVLELLALSCRQCHERVSILHSFLTVPEGPERKLRALISYVGLKHDTW